MDLFQTYEFSLHNVLIDGLESFGLLWCFYQLFGLSFWRHPFTAEDPLVSKSCNARFSKSVWWVNKLIYILDSLRVNFQHFFFFLLWGEQFL